MPSAKTRRRHIFISAKAALGDPNRSLAVDVFMKTAIESVKVLAVNKIRLTGAEGKA